MSRLLTQAARKRDHAAQGLFSLGSDPLLFGQICLFAWLMARLHRSQRFSDQQSWELLGGMPTPFSLPAAAL